MAAWKRVLGTRRRRTRARLLPPTPGCLKVLRGRRRNSTSSSAPAWPKPASRLLQSNGSASDGRRTARKSCGAKKNHTQVLSLVSRHYSLPVPDHPPPPNTPYLFICKAKILKSYALGPDRISKTRRQVVWLFVSHLTSLGSQFSYLVKWV